jgi:hypothetical protein
MLLQRRVDQDFYQAMVRLGIATAGVAASRRR